MILMDERGRMISRLLVWLIVLAPVVWPRPPLPPELPCVTYIIDGEPCRVCMLSDGGLDVCGVRFIPTKPH